MKSNEPSWKSEVRSSNELHSKIALTLCEADFLLKLQDSDGGFYFLVYPRDRESETDDVRRRPDQRLRRWNVAWHINKYPGL
jgi:hypothetical protein